MVLFGLCASSVLAPVFDPASANSASWIAFEFGSFFAFGCSLIMLVSFAFCCSVYSVVSEIHCSFNKINQ